MSRNVTLGVLWRSFDINAARIPGSGIAFAHQRRTMPSFTTNNVRTLVSGVAFIVLSLAASITSAQAQERLCDNSHEDCRTPILDLIRRETVGIDVSYWFMTDSRYSNEIIKRWRAGVQVRILLDVRSDANYPAAKTIRDTFAAAGIPIRTKVTTGINHWKTMIYAGQQKVHFSAANFANGSYSPLEKYRSYVDEAIYFTDDPDIVNTFMRKYDDLWTDTRDYANVANISGPLLRQYPMFPLHPDLNFPPDQDYADRVVSQLRLETKGIDVVMFRITSAKIPDEMIRRFRAGVPVRLITEERQYRNPAYLWHSYNIDRMYMAGIPIKWKVNDTDQDVHQKSVVLYGRDMAVFGSSNWTSSSSDTQREHNYFTSKAAIVDWFRDQFLRKWNNRKASADGGGAIVPAMFVAFAPGVPGVPTYVAPANNAANQGSSVQLTWEGGSWAHKYDIYFGTSSAPPILEEDYTPGAATVGVKSAKETYVVSELKPGTTYYWKIVSKTMADRTKSGLVWRFTTGGAPASGGTAVAIAEDAYVRNGSFASTKFGSAIELVTKATTDPGYERRAFLKLNISTVAPSDSVTLRLFGKLSDTRTSSVAVNVYGSTNTTWSESAVTWNTQPALSSTVLGVMTVTSTTARWYEVDLTAYVQERRRAGATVATIGLKSPSGTLPYAAFSSAEASTRKPEIVIVR